jgi:hypothetical protein
VSSAEIRPIHAPDTAAMRRHLEHLFGGYLDGHHDGLVELAWTEPTAIDGGHPLKHARLFGTDDLDSLVDEAARLNATPMCNVYIGAALRKPSTAPFGRTADSDAYALTAAYVDLDDPGAADAASGIYGKAKPTMVVVTGNAPHIRAQLWWKFDEPLTDPNLWPPLLRGMAAALKGDSTVTNPGRVMRLAGSVAWPVKEGRKVELTHIAPIREPGQSVYVYGHLASLFPPVAGLASSAPAAPVTMTTNSLGLADKISDGREAYMTRTIAACLVEYIGTTGTVPEPHELVEAAWPQYERHVDFSRAGRGPEEFAAKCAYTLNRFHRGEIRGIEDTDKAIAVYRDKAQARATAPAAIEPPPIRIDPATGEVLPLLLSAAQFVAGFTPPEYLIDGIMQRGYLYSLTARTGHGKTAVDMYIAQAIARGQPMHGKEVLAGTVLFLAGENPDDIRARFLVLADQFKFSLNDIKIRFIDGVVDVAASMPRIQAEAATIDDLRLVIVDTAAAYFNGDDTNNNSQQGAYARLLRQLTFLPGKPAVLVNCHPIKNAARDNLLPMGGSAFLNEIDGNLTLWANADRQTTLHWLGKFRGPEFEPITFEMETVESDQVKDAKGRKMPSVVAKPVSEIKMQFAETRTEREEITLLNFIASNKNSSIAELAIKCNFISAGGNPQKSKVYAMCQRLTEEKLLERRGSKFRITPKGKKEINWEGEND